MLSFLLFVLLQQVAPASQAATPANTMGSECGCWLWRSDQRNPSEKNAVLFVEGGSDKAVFRTRAGRLQLHLEAGQSLQWWGERDPAEATYRGKAGSLRVRLSAGNDCPPDAPDGACESFPVTGTIVGGPAKAPTAVAGRCGC